MTFAEAVVIAIVEGLTEFLPVSSTGHMIIAQKFLGTPDDDFTKLFTVGIQFGAIIAVLVLYWNRFLKPVRDKDFAFYGKLIVGVIPAIVLGLLFAKKIDALLESVFTVAVALIMGGIVLLFIDNLFKRPKVTRVENMTYWQALIIGFWQCLAMIPGTSRSAASIIGGMQQSLDRKSAAEFSFFLAVPTMAAATGYKLLKGYESLSVDNLTLFLVGNLVAFVVAMLAIKFFIGYLQKHGFKLFGYYRIALGLLLLVLMWLGYLQSNDVA
jgi:undecaprenyl-diphosphatase